MPSAWKNGEPGYSGTPGFDPYITLFLDDKRSYVPANKKVPWLPILVQLNGITAKQFKSGDGLIDPDKLGTWTAAISVPALYTEPARGLEKTMHCTAFVTEEFFKVLDKNDRGTGFIARLTMRLPLSREALPKPKRSKSRAKARP